MPTCASGTPNRSAATHEANSHVSRTITSGRQSSTAASIPGSAARASSPMNSSRITWAAPGASSRENTGAQAAARSGGSPTAQERKPARRTSGAVAGGPATATSCPARTHA